MKTTNLVLHCGAAEVDRLIVENIKTPDHTDTWYPIPHINLIQQVETALRAANMRIVNEAHSLTKEGNRYFGLFQIANELESSRLHDDYSYVLGLRNTHDKSFNAGIVVGSQVFVCDNLAFSGEIQIGRKHTKNIEIDLPKLTINAVGLLAEKWTLMTDRIAIYKASEVNDRDAHDFLIRAVDVGATTLQQVPAILKEWRAPRHPEFAQGKTAWRLFNAFTEVGKGTSLSLMPKRTISLHGLMDAQVGFASRGAEAVTEGTTDAEVVITT